VTLLVRVLKAGVVVDGVFEKTTQGCPQGSPLSPILSNIVLNELDHKLEERNLSYCRWADDFVIVVRSQRAAQRVMEATQRYLEEGLGLLVNREKSQVAPIKEIRFLGFSILRGKIRVSFRNLDGWIRSRLRSTQLKKWKKPGKFQRIMIKAGFAPNEAHRVWIKMNRWQSVMRRPVRFVMNQDWFRERGLACLNDFSIAFSRA
jgi:RNA-directed DNA polymerase